MPQVCDMGQTALLPFRRKACWAFFRPKNPTDSTGSEPAILGTRGQHWSRQVHNIIIKCINNNNTIINNNYGTFQDLILLFKISMGTRKNFFEIHRKFGHGHSKRFASPTTDHTELQNNTTVGRYWQTASAVLSTIHGNCWCSRSKRRIVKGQIKNGKKER
jgi:hypothetical protein